MFSTIAKLINRANGKAEKQQASTLIGAFALYARKDQATLMAEIAEFTAKVEQQRNQLLECAINVEVNTLGEVTRSLAAANTLYMEMLAEAERLLSIAKAEAEADKAEARDIAAGKRKQATELEAQVAQLRTLVGAFATN